MTIKLTEGCYGRRRNGTIAGPFNRAHGIQKFEFDGEFYMESGHYYEDKTVSSLDIISLCNVDGSGIGYTTYREDVSGCSSVSIGLKDKTSESEPVNWSGCDATQNMTGSVDYKITNTPVPEYDPVKVKALIGAASRVAFGSCMDGQPYSDLKNALKAIAPPKRKVYTMPDWNTLKEEQQDLIIGAWYPKEDGIKNYNRIREALAKEE
jgi:hypothetical protein